MAEPRDGDRRTGSREDAYGGGLGRALRVIRAGRDMSRADLAEAADLSPSYIAEIENGKKTPSSKALAALANALRVAVHELIEASERWTHTPPPHSFEELRGTATLPNIVEPDLAPLAAARDSAPPARVHSASARRSLLRSLSRSLYLSGDDAGSEELDAALKILARSRGGLDEARELLALLARLEPDDRERVLDLARRLGGE